MDSKELQGWLLWEETRGCPTSDWASSSWHQNRPATGQNLFLTVLLWFLPMVVIVRDLPVLNVTQGLFILFSPLFFSLFLLRRVREGAAWWAPGDQPNLSHHTCPPFTNVVPTTKQKIIKNAIVYLYVKTLMWGTQIILEEPQMVSQKNSRKGKW